MCAMKPDLNIGDLVRVVETRACGGVPNGGIGLVVEEDNTQVNYPRWVIRWVSGNEVLPGMPMRESTTYGHGLEVISDCR